MAGTVPQSRRGARRGLHAAAWVAAVLIGTGGCAGRPLASPARPPCGRCVACPSPAPPEVAASYPVVPARHARPWIETYLGGTAGPSLPEKQDLKIKRFDRAGTLLDDLFSPDVDTATEFFASLHGGLWVERGPLRDWGFEAQFMHWTTRAAADALAPKPGHVSTGERPPFDSVDQRRYALFGCLERRVFLPRAFDVAGAYAFFGVGGGVVHTVVDHGPKDWAPGAEAFAGIAIPVSERVRVRLDVRWITTHDADSKGTSESWRVDTSGRPSWPHSPHFDTRFVVPQLGVEIRF